MHRTFPAALALAALALITGCSGDDTGATGADGRQAHRITAGRQIPDSSDATDPDATEPDATDPDVTDPDGTESDGSDGQAGQDQGYADPASRCLNAMLATMDGSLPGECEGLTDDQAAQVEQGLEIFEEGQKRANELLVDSVG
ncbi:hypothetical protein ACFC00_36140 [Streptomyces adustus]|uniref:hypothetical protein n=1 Tax=Streptomyces adustus TaxID=1609272 RepID=UPI0035E1E5F3